MMARAFENQIFPITANRVGSENRGPKDRFRFTGKSQVVSPQMEMLAKANATEVVAKVARMELGLARTKRVTALNDFVRTYGTDYY